MHELELLAAYAGMVIVAALAGGYLPLVIRLTHARVQIAISFVSGMILGIGLLHLLPHGLIVLGSIDRTMIWVLVGFLFMFFLERVFPFHHHEVAEETISKPEHLHEHHHDHDHAAHGHAHHEHHHHGASTVAWASAAVGLSLHAMVDGMAMAAAIRAEMAEEFVPWAGLGTALAVTLHKPFDSLTIGTLFAAGKLSLSSRRWLTLLYALVTPVAMGLFFLISSGEVVSPQALGASLAFAAGAFLCISTSDLLPELHFHRHDRFKLSAALLAGIALAWCTTLLEPEGHMHPHADTESHEH